ncbi:MAG: MFS transporter [Victivallales bacterium]
MESVPDKSCVSASGPVPAVAWSPLELRRLTALGLSGFLLMFCYAATDIVLPLWATCELGLNASDWAHLRSLRFAGVLVGVILLGAVSDRLGQRRSTVLALLISGVATSLFWFNSEVILWVLMPVFGALLSTALVNLNTLTQMVTDTRQGVANTVYRSVGAAAGIVAPVTATFLAAVWGGYPAVFLLLGALLGMSAWALLAYPIDEPLVPLEHPLRELGRMWQGYAGALREKPLMRFIHLSQLWYCSLACVSAFAAIRLTRELGMGDWAFGVLCTAGGLVTFLLIVGVGWHLDRISLRKIHLVAGVIAAAGTLLMGASNNLVLTIVGFLIATASYALLVAPTSMWASRLAGGTTLAAAFAVQKVLAALYLSLAMLLFGLLESWLGIRMVLLICGGFGMLLSFGFLLLPESAVFVRNEGKKVFS